MGDGFHFFFNSLLARMQACERLLFEAWIEVLMPVDLPGVSLLKTIDYIEVIVKKKAIAGSANM